MGVSGPSLLIESTDSMILAMYAATSLVPRPLPVFNDTCKKREGLVHEVTCTSFRWKGDYCAWADDLFAGSACSAHSARHRRVAMCINILFCVL